MPVSLEDVMGMLETLDEQNREIIRLLKDRPGNAAPISEQRDRVTSILKNDPKKWFQPKQIITLGVQATPQSIAGTLKGLVSRNEAESKKRSEVTGIEPIEDEYDPMLYRWKSAS